MRFEIKAGGAFLIVAGVLGLSCAVFGLGLVAGYEMAKQNQPDINQISTAYPLPNSPASASSAASASIAAVPSNPAPAPSVAEAAPPPAPVTIPSAAWHGKPRVRATPIGGEATVATAARPRTMLKPRAVATQDEDEDEDSASVSEPAPAVAPPPVAAPPANKKGFNIQVEAVMDKSGADAMVARLKSLGYNAQSYQTTLGGQTWYRVRVGPYYSEEEAKAAQDKLRDQYRQAYTTSH
ncbi:MAG TPA: SPOR domain-containing protein [Candidatus Binataceae bacterium]|nr:SPOR domain-containing protein [Candidatus Binataceae bacterium]